MRKDARSPAWGQLVSDLNRLNHILIPSTKDERDRWRTSRAARVFRGLFSLLARFTDDGRLLLAFAFVAGAIALDVRRSDAYMAWAALVGLLSASFLFSFRFALRDVNVEVAVPRRVTAGEETTFSLTVRNDEPRVSDVIHVRGPFLPWDGAWIVRQGEVARVPPGACGRVDLRARFHARGDHHLDPFRLQVLTPFGLALGPPALSRDVRFLAVPPIANVVSVALPDGRRPQLGGIPGAHGTADSRELLGVRPYRFGDPVRDLHAPTWARAGAPVVRQYREEYFSRVAIVLDTDVGPRGSADFEAAISLFAGIVARLVRTEALVDVIIAGAVVDGLTVGRGLGGLDRVLDLLARVEASGPFEAGALSARMVPRLPSLSSLVLIALRWDEARLAFAGDIRSHGTACVAVVVNDADGEQAFSPWVKRISPGHVRAGLEVRV